MPISQVHACRPPKYVYGLLDLSVNVEVKGNAKTKIFSLFMDWIGDDMSQIKLIEYQTMHQTGSIRGPCMLSTQVCVWPSRFQC